MKNGISLQLIGNKSWIREIVRWKRKNGKSYTIENQIYTKIALIIVSLLIRIKEKCIWK